MSTIKNKIKKPEVAAVFAAYPEMIKDKLLLLRELIFETAAKTPGVGDIEETLKWGQPSYASTTAKIGTPIRIGGVTAHTDQYALYVNCQTSLVETFRHMYPKDFTYQGNRAIIFNHEDKFSIEKLRHCIELALTYYVKKKNY